MPTETPLERNRKQKTDPTITPNFENHIRSRFFGHTLRQQGTQELGMPSSLSVILCTRNPREDYLARVLQALRAQTLALDEWELLLIDNASARPISSTVDLRWHPRARHIHEAQLGLTSARLRGIEESRSDILVFVDDDNVLDPGFLSSALRISQEHPLVGAWGGRILPEFEEQPAAWTKPYLGMLAIREFNSDRWSNLLHQHETTPCGAGLCVRKVVAQKYYQVLASNPKRKEMDRIGDSLGSCGDTDLAFTACDMGMGTGQFTRLQVTHLIPRTRVSEAYLLKLAEGLSYSKTLLGAFRGKTPKKLTWKQKLLQQYLLWRMNPVQKKFAAASRKGAESARRELDKRAGLSQ